jgi:hypothetical protein
MTVDAGFQNNQALLGSDIRKISSVNMKFELNGSLNTSYLLTKLRLRYGASVGRLGD